MLSDPNTEKWLEHPSEDLIIPNSHYTILGFASGRVGL